MNQNILLLIFGVLLLGGVGTFLVFEKGGDGSATSTNTQLESQLGSIAQSMESMSARMGQFEQRLDALPVGDQGSSNGNFDRSMDADEIRRFIEDALADRESGKGGMEDGGVEE